MIAHKVTLNEMLDCRERRAGRQKAILSRFSTPLVSVTLVWPGKVKDTDAARYVMEQALRALDNALAKQNILYRHCEYFTTGAETIYSVMMDAAALKQLCVRLENTHPLGRLWDIDVIDKNNQPVSRFAIGLPARCCLLCAEPAHICVRSRTHNLNHLLNAIYQKIDEFKHAKQQEHLYSSAGENPYLVGKHAK